MVTELSWSMSMPCKQSNFQLFWWVNLLLQITSHIWPNKMFLCCFTFSIRACSNSTMIVFISILNVFIITHAVILYESLTRYFSYEITFIIVFTSFQRHWSNSIDNFRIIEIGLKHKRFSIEVVFHSLYHCNWGDWSST